MTNPFDAAIEELRWILETTYLPSEISNAIRVLEAAGKVDKGKILEVWERLKAPEIYESPKTKNDYSDADMMLRILFEALPEKEKI
jgi:hypothetical protein